MDLMALLMPHSSANTLSPTIIVGRKGSLGKVQYSDVPCFVIDTAYFIDQAYLLMTKSPLVILCSSEALKFWTRYPG